MSDVIIMLNTIDNKRGKLFAFIATKPLIACRNIKPLMVKIDRPEISDD